MKKSKLFVIIISFLSICLNSCSSHSKNNITISSIGYENSSEFSYPDFDNSSSDYSYSIPDRNSHYSYDSTYEVSNSQNTSSSENSSSSSSSSSSSDSSSSTITNPINIKYALTDLAKTSDISKLKEEAKSDDFYIDLAIQLAQTEIEKQGYDVFRAFAMIDNNDASNEHIEKYVTGLAFTNYELYDSNENIYSCGFIQIIIEGEEDKFDHIITDEEVSNGIMVIGMDDQSKNYVIESSIILEGFSGIYYNKFFKYKQTNTFNMIISIKDNDQTNYDEDLDLYDFDLEKYIYKASIFRDETDIQAFTLYGSKAAKAYQKAIEAIDALITLQENNEIEITLNNIIVFSEELFNNMTSKEQSEKINGILKSKLDNIQLEKNQYLTVSSENGLSIETDYSQELSQQRVANGLINTLVSMSMLVGGFVILVGGTAITGGVGGFILCTAELNTMVYAFSNLVEGAQDIYYGSKKDATESINPVKNAFQNNLQKIFKNEENGEEKAKQLGEKLYHLWGTLSTIATSFVSPISTAISKAKYCGYGIVKTALQVARTGVVHLSKIIITDKCADLVSSLSEKITNGLIGDSDPIITSLVGYASGMLTGMFVYGKLHLLDVKYDLSGLRMNPISIGNLSKTEIESERRKMGEERAITDNQTKKAGKIINETGDSQKSLLLEKDYSSKSKAQKEYYRDSTISDLNYSQGTKTVLKIIDEPALVMGRKHKNNILSYSNNTISGYYNPNIDVIYLNKDIADNDGVSTLYTIAHLMRHAYQLKYAEVNSPILKSLRDENYSIDDTSNLAEIDANNFATYYLERAKYALSVKEANKNIQYISYPYGEFPTPSSFYEGEN